MAQEHTFVTVLCDRHCREANSKTESSEFLTVIKCATIIVM